VAVAGTYAYVADFDRALRIIDVSDPEHPSEVGSCDTPDWPWGVAVAGNYAYVANGESGLRIIEVSDPQHPSEVGSCDTPDWAWGVAVAGNYAYVVGNSGSPDYDGWLRVINVFEPANPSEEGSYDTPGRALGVAVAGNYAYVADWESGLRIINVSNPLAPTDAGFYDTPGNAVGVAVAGNYAYVANGSSGLRIINVSNPLAPTEAGFYDTPGYADGVAVAGNYAYVADCDMSLHIINVSDPANPSEVGSYDTPVFYWATALAGNYAYAVGWTGLHIIDVSDPANPSEVGSYDMGPDSHDVAVAGNYAYVANTYGGLRIVDISDPAHPTEVGSYDTPGLAHGVAVAGNYAYVADCYSGLRIVNVSDPNHPTEVSSYDTTGCVAVVAVAGNYAYVPDGETGLRIISVSDPEHPSEVGSSDTPGYAHGVEVADSYAYVADGDGGLRIIDVSDPEHPSEVGSCDTPWWDVDIAMEEDYAYVVEGSRGLRIINVSDPEHPTQVGFYDTPDYAYGVAVAEKHAYVADGNAGLVILRFTGGEPTPTPVVTTLAASEPTLNSATLNGTVNPNGSNTSAWFEWGTDPSLAAYAATLSQTVGAGTEPVVVTATLTNLEPILPYYYRAVAQNPGGTARGEIKRLLILLGNDPTGGNDPYWNKYDRLIYVYAHQQNLPATVVKAIVAHESAGLGTENCNASTGRCVRNHREKPDLAFLYEPVTVDEGYAQKNPGAYPQYRLPYNPPQSGQYPYNRFWATEVIIPPGTTNLQMMSKDYYIDGRTLAYGLTNPAGTPTKEFIAQYRLASSYGLGQLLYWWHHDRINDQAPEALYDAETNIKAMVEYLDQLRRKCTPALGEQDLNVETWKPTVQAYNSNKCGECGEGYWPGIQRHSALTTPALAPEGFDASQILSPILPISVMATDAVVAFLTAGEYEVDRLVADVKGTGQSQLVAAYAVVTDTAIGVEAGKLKVFADEAESAVEWESPSMEGVLAVGAVFTETVPGGGAPMICAMWGAGAHGTRLYPFRWDGQTFRSISAVGPTGEQTFGFFGDAGVGIVEGQAWVGGRDSAQPLSVFHIATYDWEASTQTFQWVGEETISNAIYRLYLPLILRN